MSAMRLEFGDFRFDPGTGELAGPSETLKLRPQAAKTLELLAGANGELVSRDHLRRELWPDKRVVLFEVSISTVVRELRRALGDDPHQPRFIETIPRRGYRFVSPVTLVEGPVSRTVTAPRRIGPAGHLARAAGFLALLTIVLLLGGTASIPESRSSEGGNGDVSVLALRGIGSLSDTPAANAFAGALNDELATTLAAAGVPDFRVVEPESPMGRSPAYVLDGSVRTDDEGWLVTARVGSAADGGLVWSERFRRRDDPGPLATRDIAARIAQGVLDNVAPRGEGSRLPEAVTAYRKGRQLMSLHTAEATQGAINAFENSVSLDPGYAQAHAALSEALLKWPGVDKTPEVVERARGAATKALELDPTLGGAHWALGQVALFYDWDWPQAGAHLRRAVNLAPADARMRDAWASWLSARGRNEEALREIRLAQSLDPSEVAISIDVMLFHFFARDYQGTLEAAQRLAKLWPGNYASDYYSMFALLSSGDRDGAAGYAEQALVRWDRRRAEAGQPIPAGGDPSTRLWERWLAGLLGRVDQTSVDQLAVALACVQLGRYDEALDRIKSATREHYFSYQMPFLGVSPALDPLRGDPRFEYVLRGLGEAALTDYYDGGRVARSEGEQPPSSAH